MEFRGFWESSMFRIIAKYCISEGVSWVVHSQVYVYRSYWESPYLMVDWTIHLISKYRNFNDPEQIITSSRARTPTSLSHCNLLSRNHRFCHLLKLNHQMYLESILLIIITRFWGTSSLMDLAHFRQSDNFRDFTAFKVIVTALWVFYMVSRVAR